MHIFYSGYAYSLTLMIIFLHSLKLFSFSREGEARAPKYSRAYSSSLPYRLTRKITAKWPERAVFTR